MNHVTVRSIVIYESIYDKNRGVSRNFYVKEGRDVKGHEIQRPPPSNTYKKILSLTIFKLTFHFFCFFFALSNRCFFYFTAVHSIVFFPYNNLQFKINFTNRCFLFFEIKDNIHRYYIVIQ